MKISKKNLYIIATLLSSTSLLLNAYRSEVVSPRFNVLIGVLAGISLGIYFANYFKKEI